jgi:hypothetical protein
MHWPIANQKRMVAAKDSGAMSKSSIDGPRGTKSTITVHQIESMASALARRE